ncbi:hypothetical protein AaE_011055 [Aphanomyces astaci]|uniref:Uncharacterized protein n=1 Tax=Aphanomyces astaci TaxID=112090 RepID=A0A6A4ZUI3_APHAT|nr:hypothetical protein AaE_011055 [Aphanomyces astaci]
MAMSTATDTASPRRSELSSTLARRRYECERKRRYRADQRCQRAILVAEITALQETLQRTLSIPQQRAWSEVTKRFETDLALRAAKRRKLRDQVHRQQELLLILHEWVGRSVGRSLRDSRPWQHSTLLAHPESRQYGFQWLLDRVFHAANSTLSSTFNGSIADFSTLQVHVDDNQDILGMESHHQVTLLAGLNDVTACYVNASREIMQSSVCHVETVLEEGELLYWRLYNTQLGTSMCRLTRSYHLASRVVCASIYVRDDECFPLQPNELRPHGFGWTVMDAVTDSITLCRTAVMQYAPVTTDGVVTFERTAAMFGVEPSSSRDVVLARIENNALRNFVAGRASMVTDMETRIASLHLTRPTS